MTVGSATTSHPTDAAQSLLLSMIEGGRDTPEEIVAEAQKVTSPLHAYFEWDDDLAAHQYRIHQARKLVARVKITATIGSQKINVRAVVNVKDESGDHYVVAADHRDDPGFQAQMIRRYTDTLRQLYVKYAYLLNDEQMVRNLAIDVLDEIFEGTDGE